MGDANKTEPSKLSFKFIRGVDGEKTDYEWSDGAEIVRKALAESLNAGGRLFVVLGQRQGGRHPNDGPAREGIHGSTEER
jgi:hypothetical protein